MNRPMVIELFPAFRLAALPRLASPSGPNGAGRVNTPTLLREEPEWTRARMEAQFTIHIPDAQEHLSDVIETAMAQGLKVLAHHAVRSGSGTTWFLVVDDDWMGRKALELAGIRYGLDDVILVEAAPRTPALARLRRCLAQADTPVVYSYAAPTAEDRLVAVFKTADDERMLRHLQVEICGSEPAVASLAA